MDLRAGRGLYTMPKRVVVFVWSVCASAIVAFGCLWHAEPTISPVAVQAILWLIALGLVADALGHEIDSAAGGSTAFIPYLTAAALAPVWLTVVGIAASMLLQGVLARRANIKTIFNVGQATLSVSLAILAFRSLGGQDLASAGAYAFVALVVVFLGLNTMTVSAVIGAVEGKPVFEVWYKNTRSTVLYDVLALPFVFIFAKIYVQWGAVGVFGFAAPLLGARQLYKTNWRLERTNQELLQLMVAAIEARDPYTSGHSQRVSAYSKIIARALRLPEREIERIGRAALLHDVGKIHEAFAPILRKTSRLTPEEHALMQTHAQKSAELIQNVSYLRDIVDTVRHHHENWDGSGYPAGLAGDAIPIGSRVIMIADTVDAMMTDRPYRKALTRPEVTAELTKLRGKQFDAGMCDTLLASPLYNGLFQCSVPSECEVVPIASATSAVRMTGSATRSIAAV